MFGILKKKLSKAIESISEKFKKKEEIEDKIEKKSEVLKEEIEEKVEEIGEKKPEEIVKEIEEKVEEIGEKKPEEIKLEIKIAPEAEKEVEKIIEEAKPEIEKAEPKEKKSIFKKITEKIVKKVTEKKLSEAEIVPILDELENDLIEADVAFPVAEKIKNDLKNSLLEKEVKRRKEREIVIEALKNSLLEILSVPKIDLDEIIKKAKGENRPAVIIFFGINGVGKSLNISKLAKMLKNKGHRPVLAAADTFRAAGDIQLEMYAQKVGVPSIRGMKGGDSCAIIFDARKSAESKGYDVVLADTSGRMHTKKDLLDELAKIVRVNKPDLKVLVLDSLSGGDVLLQYDLFDKAVGIDAVIFSKVDVNEKGGNILSVCNNFKKPILFLGTGQNPEDIIEFNPQNFISNLLS